MGDISEHPEDKNVSKNRQHGLTKGKSCLAKPDCLQDEVTAFVQEGRTAGVIYLSFRKTFGMVCLHIFVLELGHYSLDGQTSRWVKHQLDDQAERTVVKASYPT